MKLDMENRHLKIVQDILSRYPYKFYAFGSRVRGCAKKFSDLDICFFDDISLAELSQIEEAFEESDLPYKVDLINWNSISIDFRKIIENDLVLLERSF
jgi:predicted nucleotidyltransferase